VWKIITYDIQGIQMCEKTIKNLFLVLDCECTLHFNERKCIYKEDRGSNEENIRHFRNLVLV
jgi:hypothetical protein